ncbi:MAG: DEAD/DEAH box helicase family protein [Candidatus Cohnella colombiensis]|uniref:DEAD/DEAH box helicase family protein n=1 Tax=Candidatus Cohnella colombiensis TaxID=3121368 RepID=A0AA95EU48_9BACL|nr:MAG: DEAD/DEAH box helicase family protein [Cohnella sp.]
MGIVPKGFQLAAIDNAYSVLSDCLSDIEKVRLSATFDAQKKTIVAHKGCLLFEAPTGTGKTLMAGCTMEELSKKHKILWFWFAPFSGLIDQATNTVKAEFPKLTAKSVDTERHVANLRSGDVFITTWSSVAVSNAESRKVRQNTETMPSIDEMIVYAKKAGFHIGVVVDESHHSFRGQSQAFSFYKDVINPDITIMATATPKDVDVDNFIQSHDIKYVHRISVSRQQGIDAGLLKSGVKVAVFKANTNISGLIDFRKTALQCGVRTHREIKQILADQGQNITPLLLIQADSSEDSIKQITNWLHEFGFRTENIRVHTADEPDPHLIAIAHDESVEALIFKMSVATGFDAPRAFTLVSMRTSRDSDFGIQIVGRIMRVDKRLQGDNPIPEQLKYGYVFLSDKEGQTGLTSAAQRINAIKSELAPLTRMTDVVAIDNDVHYVNNGQISLFTAEQEEASGHTEVAEVDSPTSNASEEKAYQFDLFNFWGFVNEATDPYSTTLSIETDGHIGTNGTKGTAGTAGATEAAGRTPSSYTYRLRTDISYPRQFKRAVVSLDNSKILTEIVNKFAFDERTLSATQQSATRILMEQTEIFEGRRDRPHEINALLAQVEIDKLAQQSLFSTNRDGIIDIRSLHAALAAKLQNELERMGWMHMTTPDKVREGLHKILVLRPEALKKAVDEAIALNTEVENASFIPDYIITDHELAYSRLNIYGVYPSDLNTWETAFAEDMDNDLDDIIVWWHRNLPRKDYSVCLPLPGQPNFYPDFIVGIKNRTRGNGILLVEVKRVINDENQNAQLKAQAVHPEYKKVMMVYWENEDRWLTVEYDETHDKNILDRVLRFDSMQSY